MIKMINTYKAIKKIITVQVQDEWSAFCFISGRSWVQISLETNYPSRLFMVSLRPSRQMPIKYFKLPFQHAINKYSSFPFFRLICPSALTASVTLPFITTRALN
jgi:hypothetical protein